MKIRYYVFLITLLSILFVSNSAAQQTDKGFERDIEGLPFLFLNLPRTAQTSANSGFYLSYNYPGFISFFGGELGLVYKNNGNDSYSFRVGNFYIMVGINKYLFQFNNSSIYANLNIGTMSTGILQGSGGISYLVQAPNNSRLELAIEAFFHDGVGGGHQFIPIFLGMYHTRGILADLTYSIKLFSGVTFSLSAGISYTQFRYAEYDDYYKYISRQEANEKDYIGNTMWETHWMVPFGATLTIHL